MARNNNKTMPVKAFVTTQEKVAVKKAAAAEGRTVSSWLRQLILDGIKGAK